MGPGKLAKSFATFIGLMITMRLLYHPLLLAGSPREHVANAAIAVFMGLGVRSFCLMCVSFYHWYNGK